MTEKDKIKKYCYSKWLNSDKTWNHYLASRILHTYLIEDLSKATKYIEKYKQMRKLIDIPEEIVKPLKILAIEYDTDLKNYIQDLLIAHVLKAKK